MAAMDFGDELIISSTNSILGENSENKINEKQIDESTEILIANLEEYIIDSTETGKLKRQFMAIKKGQCKSRDVFKLPVNKPQNRYGNLPCDEARVVSQICGNGSHSDYINANYVDGYKRPKKYIATQGPKQTTIHHFWRMICQENVCKIVMVTNLVENGKTKCEKYWPETEENYGNINVWLKDTEVYLDYVIRTFIITQEKRMWILKHFHYTTWPDHDVPRFTNSVISFLQNVRNFKPESNSPIVVHCSAGDGRTGTLILLDSMLDMAYTEERVDLVSYLTNMCQQRINTVETYAQYRFVYRALADSLCEYKTSILRSDYNEEIDRLKKVNASTGKTGFHIQYERLERLRPKLKPVDCRSGYEIDNQLRNRNLNVVPPEKGRVILRGCDSESNYINAVYIDGYKRKDSFIVTEIPLPNTVSDFWRMMLNSESNTLILLNELDEVCPYYWPNLNHTIIYENTEVSNISAEMYDCIIIRTFQLRDLTRKGATTKTIKQFHLNNWPCNSYIPYSDENILHLIDRVEKWQQQTDTLTSVVQCLDGVRACGIYCTCVFVLDKIKTEQEVDVFQAVRCIRGNRPQLIENLEQFVLCYRVATTYLDSFQIYANIQ
ncbi:receptor-type tyrosine-protein phosphatase T-like [Centruroides vittatus]|uniref:receptor-type tyrosine-protein phosphatase T-like n=1 Tax=Centruroides vittatus TaxID=120091 RepID=UPI00350F7A88